MLRFIALLSLFLAAHAAQSDQRQLGGFVLANNHFGWKLLNQLSKENAAKSAPENVFFSPYSLSSALAMLHQGSGGETTKQIASLLGFELANLTDKAIVNEQIRQSDATIRSDGQVEKSPNIVKSGNALLVNKNFPLVDAFKDSLRENYRAEAFSVDFSRDANGAKDLINQWCSNVTNGKIAQLLNEAPSADTKLTLLNAVYFKGEWLEKFESAHTYQDKFYGLNGATSENVSFMSYTNPFNVAQLEDGLNASLLELPYKGKDVSFYGLLPTERTASLGPIRAALQNASFIEAAIGRTESFPVRLSLPKLKFKTEYDLVDSLVQLGLVDAFDGSKADLSALSTAAQLKVDKVRHVATVEVNEEGTEAAAATSIGITTEAAISYPNLKVLKFDHPFLFFIRHNQNGQILFIGEVNKV